MRDRNVNEDHLKEIFGCFGGVKDVSIQYRPRTHLSSGSAVVELDSEEDARKCIDGMNNGQIDGGIGGRD